MKTFRVRNWEEFQHYKDRNPPWIKLHNQLLDDYEFECLGDAAKGHLLCIWMLASRTNNKMPYDDKWVTKKIGASSKVNLESLIESGFLVVEQDASKSLQSVEQDAPVSVPLEEERRGKEEERRKRASKSFCEEVSTVYMVTLPELPNVKLINDKRVSEIRGCIKEFSSTGHDFTKLETWKGLFEYIRGSKYLMGEINDFSASFDWIINKNNLLKIIEGKYE